MVISNSSSSSMTSSTISRESAPTSSIKDVERVTCSLLTPRFSQTISITRSSIFSEATMNSSQRGARTTCGRPLHQTADLPRGVYVPQRTYPRQDVSSAAQYGRIGKTVARRQIELVQGDEGKGKSKVG